jgi:prepilin-type N-terminal cleavage/methylation domain-containing protein
MRREKGFTLVETLVAMALLAMVITLVASVLIPALHSWSRNDARSQASQALVVLAARLRREALASNPADTVCTASTLSLVSAESDSGLQWNGCGCLLWEKQLVFYLSGTNAMLHEVDFPQPTSCPVLPSGFVPLTTDHVLARNITTMTFTPQMNGLIQVGLAAQVDTASAELQTCLTPAIAPGAPPSASPGPSL